ncbi:hypothetical protein COW36_09355 [bacterium (Candidatus Blackallbacteria) CG17_big_fil_post_rev_8_21_14_2_50_48_46]|uniref:Sulfatase-modifying factor enzyme-like domain-containing protein n=1 Tax=bacterium (Candidatus Blackallbacteria) CG17_big_fil_post_rev_8_21_14_2_50_48_46 TaxID=2014261 RepID=A0A2M7G5Y7_9BACT|nr:MAG: hypothetical protein COW64_23695 [bacterium (Candidatus Blackallbacteria) CG18_big_fil_WC_8_21_14_2_50_49_26]PIW17378.1 MAG: hypothetical protein COW36_09355 [bacterium (Candidatus Blackallbacteria) CG17_big_fil_post_rev_8_21_14_2_50_48_46]PIW47480.1 MAG: hypothetical protein COW20_12475 [bacterium (Candidatus Blackallbacteria) CG13_big_fil_rev_8_21_14_2_50_49_14]
MKGTVYLGFVNGDLSLVNLDKAEESFLLAARYAKTDYPEDSARAFLSAGWAAYCQGKMKEALAHTEMAMTLHPQMGEAFFQAAKVLMATNQVNLALPVIRKAIDLDRFYIFKAAGDGDFQKHNDTFCHFLNDLRAEKYNQILPVTQELAGQLDFYRQNSPEALHDQRLQQMDLFLDTGHNWALYDLVDFSSVLEQFRTELEKKRIWLNEDVVHTLYEEDPVNEVYRAEVKYQVEEVYQEEKTYQERVIIKPAGLWRAAVTELQTKTHMVDKTRLVSKTNWVEKTRIVMKTVEFYVGERIEKEYNGLGVLINSKSYMDNPNRVKSYVDHYNQDFVLIKAGSFSRGVGSNAKSFTVYQDFYIAQYPVTQKLWQQVMGDNPSKNKRDENCPVEQVSWYDAQSFIKKLNDQAGQNVYRLPTAREWEYACRAGSNGNYCFGDKESELGQYAWYDKNSGGRTHPVAQKKPNAWGLYDMHGNVQEWCKNEFYEPSILRGGGWNTTAYSCSFDNNSNTNILLNIRSDDFGFRLVRSE